jgi:hypothetical protein
MPTGYTAKLVDKGQDFREFVLTCARGMGACIMQRDDPMDEPPKRTEPSDYHTKKITDAEALLARLKSMTTAQQAEHGAQLRTEAIGRYRGYLAENVAQNERLEAMAAQVRAWNPPTDEHNGLKDFMLDQILISKNDTKYSERSLAEAEAKTPEAYFVEAVSSAARDLTYHAEEHAKEVKRTSGRNDWIDKLYESLPNGQLPQSRRET